MASEPMPSWRDRLEVHPAADLFPMMSDEELQALAEDIQKNGLRTKIVVWRPSNLDVHNGTQLLLDGRNRLTAMEMAGIDPFHADGKKLSSDYFRAVCTDRYYKDFRTDKEAAKPDRWHAQVPGGHWVGDPYEFVVSLNIHRRNLTQEQKRELIAKLLKVQPDKRWRRLRKFRNRIASSARTARASRPGSLPSRSPPNNGTS
jgi:hypothetical protein